MKKITHCLFVIGGCLAWGIPAEAAEGAGSWSELVNNYQGWRPVYSMMVPPLKASISEIEKDIAAGTYAFTLETHYYWDLTGGDFRVDKNGEIAQAVVDGTWVYVVEDLATAKVYVMKEGQPSPLATFAAETWPPYNASAYASTLLNCRNEEQSNEWRLQTDAICSAGASVHIEERFHLRREF